LISDNRIIWLCEICTLLHWVLNRNYFLVPTSHKKTKSTLAIFRSTQSWAAAQPIGKAFPRHKTRSDRYTTRLSEELFHSYPSSQLTSIILCTLRFTIQYPFKSRPREERFPPRNSSLIPQRPFLLINHDVYLSDSPAGSTIPVGSPAYHRHPGIPLNRRI
jgi:hypothetical protein